MAARERRTLEIVAEVKDQATRHWKRLRRTVGGFATSARRRLQGVRRAVLSIKTAVIGVAALFAAGVFARGLQAIARDVDDVAKSARRLQISVETLSELRFAAELSGLEFERLKNGLRRFQRELVRASEGQGRAAEAFRAFGVRLRDQRGELRGTEEILVELAEGYKLLGEGPQRAAFAQEIFGRRMSEVVSLLEGGAEGLRELRREARLFGAAITGQQASDFEAFNDSLTRLRTVFVSIARELARGILSEVQQQLENLARFIAENRGDIIAFFKNVGRVILAFAKSVIGAMAEVAEAINEISMLPNVFETILEPSPALRLPPAVRAAASAPRALLELSELLADEVVARRLRPDRRGSEISLEKVRANFRKLREELEAIEAGAPGAGSADDPRRREAQEERIEEARRALAAKREREFQRQLEPLREQAELRRAQGLERELLQLERKERQELQAVQDSLRQQIEERELTEQQRTQINLAAEQARAAIEEDFARQRFELEQQGVREFQRQLEELREQAELRRAQGLERELLQLERKERQELKAVQDSLRQQIEERELTEQQRTQINLAAEQVRAAIEEDFARQRFELEQQGVQEARQAEQERLRARREANAAWLRENRTTIDGIRTGLRDYVETQGTTFERARADALQTARLLESSFAGALTQVATGAKSAKEAFRSLMADVFAQLTRLAASRLFQRVFGSIFGLFGGGRNIDPGDAIFPGTIFTGGGANAGFGAPRGRGRLDSGGLPGGGGGAPAPQGGGEPGQVNVTFNVNAFDSRSVRRMLVEESDTIKGVIVDAVTREPQFQRHFRARR